MTHRLAAVLTTGVLVLTVAGCSSTGSAGTAGSGPTTGAGARARSPTTAALVAGAGELTLGEQPSQLTVQTCTDAGGGVVLNASGDGRTVTLATTADTGANLVVTATAADGSTTSYAASTDGTDGSNLRVTHEGSAYVAQGSAMPHTVDRLGVTVPTGGTVAVSIALSCPAG